MKKLFALRSVSAKAIVLSVAMIALSIAACTFLIMNHFHKILGTDRLRQNLKAAEMILNPGREAYAIRDGYLYVGERRLNGNYTSVDEVASAFGGVATIFQNDTRISTSVRKTDGSRATGTKIDPKVSQTVLREGQQFIGEVQVLGRPFLTVYEPLKDTTGRAIGVFVVAFEKSEFEKTFTDAVVMTTISGLILALICGGLGGFIYKRLFAPFKPLSRLMEEAQAGRYTAKVPYVERRDEFGTLAKVILEFNKTMKKQEEIRAANEAAKIRAAEEQKQAEEESRRRNEELVVGTFGEGLKALAHENLSFRLDGAVPPAYQPLKEDFNHAIAASERSRKEREEAAIQREADRLKAEQAQKKAEAAASRHSIEVVTSSFGEALAALARRDLTYRLKSNLPDEYRILQDDFNNAISQFEDAMKEIGDHSDDIATNTTEISKAAQEMAQRTERQAAALEQTAAAVNEITSNVAKSAESAKTASDRANDSQHNAERGNEVARNAVEAMRGIARSSSEISQIIGVIDEIAFQTNLLAINAAVEAAHAGDTGKGFAVVASEVRSLAQRSAGAAKEIKALIRTSEEQVGNGVKLVEESGKALISIVGDIGQISSLMANIATTQREQATALKEVDEAVGQMDQTTQQNAAMAEESNASSEAMAGYARELAALVAQFGTRKKESASREGREAA
jgi:methyl-accepting chemotaxis protein